MSGKEEPRETAHMWFQEWNSPSFNTNLSLTKVMYEGKSEFQKVQVIETAQFGKTLVLDGKTQSALSDEFMYHEGLVHPAMLLHPCPKVVYIGGGGELATAREVLRYPSVEKVIMVDLDEQVVEICKTELPEWNDGCINDPRLEVVYQDAHEYMKNYEGMFDVIIMDIADPIEAGPGIVLYTEEFYKFAGTKLNEGGVLVTQSGACSLYNFEECFTAINSTLRNSFENVAAYRIHIPSFAGCWGFNLAYNKSTSCTGSYANMDPEAIDTAITTRIPDAKLKFYDGITHRGLFSLPKPIREGMAKESRTITIDNPVFMY
mmetsp:Transcript_14534/g.23666  ORF Transcript_14534/g.23666 Transcript_14534/m.23666 type:complete len:318 (+) Transcript_14534:119-1072(+)|eukprot:CAMPEP_0203765994 /NCGR_PEP_ID=MMETSP0099_2-20121227/168_1 /ASSEMBLY_ACC=CAM_ASM_000209 /TAXON_ID=96639 /ORGANISM=" , Strain NY0313808BC1" /LENGTH=317 /DNA_ID=CAMNT_0050662289 /DNA_START=245 /DNA_END=1198 /DNA_ORIENTATION=-